MRLKLLQDITGVIDGVGESTWICTIVASDGLGGTCTNTLYVAISAKSNPSGEIILGGISLQYWLIIGLGLLLGVALIIVVVKSSGKRDAGRKDS